MVEADPPDTERGRNLRQLPQTPDRLGPAGRFLWSEFQHVAGMGLHRPMPVETVQPTSLDPRQVLYLGGGDQPMGQLQTPLDGQDVTGLLRLIQLVGQLPSCPIKAAYRAPKRSLMKHGSAAGSMLKPYIGGVTVSPDLGSSDPRFVGKL